MRGLLLAAAPDWTAKTTAIATAALAFLGLITFVAVSLAFYQLLESRRLRDASLAADLSRRWDDELVPARSWFTKQGTPEGVRDAYRQLKDERSEVRWVVQRLPNFFEDLGALQKRRCISLSWIENTLGSAVLHYWSLWRLEAHSERENSYEVYVNFQYLAEAVTTLRENAEQSAKAKAAKERKREHRWRPLR